MSNLLRDAIVDAKALREAALKSAETTVIDKYSEEVRHTLNQLLEQEEELAIPPAGEAEMELPPPDMGAGMDTEPAGTGEEVAADIPLAATDNLSENEGEDLKSK